jgi:hypothetical protein
VEFSYELTGVGWAEATIVWREQTAKVTVSYLTADALGDLLGALTDALGPLADGSCTWLDEPGRHVWSFRREGQDIEVVIDMYEGWGEMLAPSSASSRDERPTTVFEATARATELGFAVVGGRDDGRVRDDHFRVSGLNAFEQR